MGITVTREWHGDEAIRRIRSGGARGTTRAGEQLKTYSVPLAPLRDSPLRNSANVDPATESQAEPQAVLVFATPYAAKQHEEMDYQHDDGQAKYVEEPMNEHQRDLIGIIAADVKGSLNG